MIFKALRLIIGVFPNKSLYFIYIKKVFEHPFSFDYFPNMRFMSSSVKSYFRYKKILSKEPDMIGWIDSFHKNSTFWDVGANVGVFTFYANYSPNVDHIYAFEPDPLNYYELTRNMILNRTNKIKSFNCGLGPNDISLFDIPYDSLSLSSGGSFRSLDFENQNKKSYGINVISFSFSGLLQLPNVKAPNYIKIDIDGLEEFILRGQENFFKQSSIREVMIEVDDTQPQTKKFIFQFFSNCGYEQKSVNETTPNGTTFNVLFSK